MSALFIAQVRVQDTAKMAEYRRRLGPVMRKFGGRMLGADDAPATMRDEADPGGTVVAAFPDHDAIRKFLGSAEYQPLAELRRQASQPDGVEAG